MAEELYFGHSNATYSSKPIDVFTKNSPAVPVSQDQKDSGGEAKWVSVSGGETAAAFEAKLTAYDACKHCTGKDNTDPAYGITKTGARAETGRTIAVDPKTIPLGSWVYIDGLGVFHAEDTGGAISGNRIDVFLNSHEEALKFGVQTATVHFMAGPQEMSVI